MSREIKFRVWDTFAKEMVIDPGFERIGSYHEPCDHPIMQFTGLQDKNGMAVFEGDVVDCRAAGLAVVVFSDGSFRMPTFGNTGITSDRVRRLEVIGNIHQHADLIEEIEE